MPQISLLATVVATVAGFVLGAAGICWVATALAINYVFEGRRASLILSFALLG